MLKNFVILVLIIIVLMMGKSIYAPNHFDPIITTKIDTIRKDTTITRWKPGKDIYHDTTIYDTIPTSVPVDTNAILRDFFAKNVFKDTLHIPEGLISIIDTISKNKIQGRSYNAQITQKTIKEVRELRYPEKPKMALYWGFMGIKQDEKYDVGGGLLLKTKNNGVFQLNYTLNKQIQVGYYTKIF